MQVFPAYAFKMIFMDCNMPIMNGFTTTKNIVDICKKANCEVPYIVALTANDLSKDLVDKCLQCGMQEVIMKPISSKQVADLFSKLEV